MSFNKLPLNFKMSLLFFCCGMIINPIFIYFRPIENFLINISNLFLLIYILFIVFIYVNEKNFIRKNSNKQSYIFFDENIIFNSDLKTKIAMSFCGIFGFLFSLVPIEYSYLFKKEVGLSYLIFQFMAWSSILALFPLIISAIRRFLGK